MHIRLSRAVLLSLVLPSICWCQDATDLTQLSVDDLSKVQVTSASKKTESLSEAPAAIFVLTQEMIRQAGITTLPEALRMVPGLYVTQTNSHAWQISTRGFSGINNRKMLVLVDGRSVYSPAFGGVFWDLEDIPLENIERIEVIRGPGGTLWGANAVNGVINIVTRSADRSAGITVSTSADLYTGYTSFIQYGGAMGDHLNYRVYGKASYWEPLDLSSGTPLLNSFALPQAGMRTDWAVSRQDAITIEATELNGRYQGSTVPVAPVQAELLKDTNVALRWKHTISSRSAIEAFSYCDWYSHESFPEETQNTCSLEFQHDFAFNTRHLLIWGGSFLTNGDSSIDFLPQYRRINVSSGFFQYEYVVIPNRLRVLAGSKFEGHPSSGIQYQPQARAVWTVNRAHSFWGSFSRAVHDPSHSENDLNTISGVTVGPGGVTIVRVVGDSHLGSEHLRAYELGYRLQTRSTLSFDLATYYNSYEHLIELATSQVQVFPGQTLITQTATNETAAMGGTAQTHGAELSANWQPIRRWMISPTVTEIRGSPNAVAAIPRHLFGVQTRFDLAHNIYFPGSLYHCNAVAPVSGSSPAPGVPTFNRVDLGTSWRLRPQWTLGMWGRNLQSDKHVESSDDFFGGPSAAIPRSVSFKLMWQSSGSR
jgi:iron complex outermembrane receptor protein